MGGQTTKSAFLTTERLETLHQWTQDQGHMARILRMGDPTTWDALGSALEELVAVRAAYVDLRLRMDGLEK